MTKINDLEKRVEKLEHEIMLLKNNSLHVSHSKTHTETEHSKPHSETHTKSHSKIDSKTHTKTHTKSQKKKETTKKESKNTTKKKKPVNAYFKMMLEAKKEGKESFMYNGSLYKGTKHPRLGMVYKKA
jgi:hypothetical protein